MASAFTTLANRGDRVEPTMIVEVTTASGRVLERARSGRSKVLERRHADIVNHVLRQVVESGSGMGAPFGRPLAGKTGTTQKFGDAWFVGYTPRLTAAVWMGYPEGSSRPMTNVRGRKVTGGSFPASIFKRFMQAATAGYDTGTFPAVTAFPGRTLASSKRAVIVTTTTTSTSTTTTVPGEPTTLPPGPVPPTTAVPVTSSTTATTKPTTTTSTTTKKADG